GRDNNATARALLCIRIVWRARHPVGLCDIAGAMIGDDRLTDHLAERLGVACIKCAAEEQPLVTIAGASLDNGGLDTVFASGFAGMVIATNHEGKAADCAFQLAAAAFVWPPWPYPYAPQRRHCGRRVHRPAPLPTCDRRRRY